MSTINSASTDQQVIDAVDDNASYEEDKSVAKARAFITAVRIRVNRAAAEVWHGQEKVRMDENLRQWRLELAEARKWLGANGTASDGGGGVVVMSPDSGFRG